MVLNRVWMGMFVIALIVGFSKMIFWQDTHILQKMMDAMMKSAETGFNLALFMTAALSLWMGILKIGEDGGAIRVMTRLVSPLFYHDEFFSKHVRFGQCGYTCWLKSDGRIATVKS